MSDLLLDPVEARVLACLVEKSITTPAYYPMTVNALAAAANQKTARAPLMNLSEGEVGAALNRLEAQGLVSRDTSSPRAIKWRQRLQHERLLKPAPLAVLATLMLRGPLTAAELRSQAAALGGPADAESLTAVLEDLADRAQPLVVTLPRAAGQSAVRHAHTLCGLPTVEAESETSPAPRAASADRLSALLARIEALEARVAALEAGSGAG